MEYRKKADILGCSVDTMNMEGVVAQIKQYLSQGISAHIITLNAEIVYSAQKDLELKRLINSAALVTPDGIGTVWAGRVLGYEIPERVTGIDLLHRLCRESLRAGWGISLLGAAPGVAEQAAEKLREDYPGIKITGVQHGYFQEEEIPAILHSINEQAPDVLLVALGAPRQEFWIRKHQRELGVPICIGVGGSFDVVAGNKKRAPELMIKMNLEWLYRLFKEPQRLQRQLVLPLFMTLVIKQRWCRQKNGV